MRQQKEVEKPYVRGQLGCMGCVGRSWSPSLWDGQCLSPAGGRGGLGRRQGQGPCVDLSFALTFSLTRALASAMGDLGVQPAVSVPGPPWGRHLVGLGSCPHTVTGVSCLKR